MFKSKSITGAVLSAILISFVLQISMFGASISSRRNVTGTVYASPGLPVSSATVLAYGTDGYGIATTNINGQYTITEGLLSGNYTVRVSREGYLDREKENVAVTAGSETSGINFLDLNRSGGISGRITDAVTNFNIPNIIVTASPSGGGGTYFGQTFTDITGNYTLITNLATGTYNVTVPYPKGYVMKTRGPINVLAGIMTTGIDLALQRSGIIFGTITTPGGQPLENLTVAALSEGGEMYMGSDETNATGYYSIGSGLGTGTYTVTVSSGLNVNFTMGVSVTAGGEPTRVDMQLSVTPPPPSGIIMGKVTDASSRPIEDALVSADGDTTLSHGDAYTDADGNYIISRDLQTDTYTVIASAPGYQTKNVTNLSVLVDHVSVANFQLSKISAAQSGRISGTVTGEADPLVPEFQYPIAAMLIMTLLAVAIAKLSANKTKYHAARRRNPSN